MAADLNVPADYASIQAAVNAAGSGDVIHVAAGLYNETLTVTKSVNIDGAGTNATVIYCLTNVPIISIKGPVRCRISNLEVEGGQYMQPGWFSGLSSQGIVASNATLTLAEVIMNQFNNCFVEVVNGYLMATNVGLWTRDVLSGADLGFQIKGSTAIISGLHQDAGHLDHTININDYPAVHSEVTLDNCRIRASGLSYGNCVRTYSDSNVRISRCFFYRDPGDPVPAFPAFNHNGLSVSGSSNAVTVTGNTFSDLPWALYCYGSLGGNRVLVESNAFLNSKLGGIAWDAMSYQGIDLGGGSLGSKGHNAFSESPVPFTGFCADVLFTNLNGPSTANIFALANTWSNPADRESVIYDKLDNPAMGRLITEPLVIKWADLVLGNMALSWSERGAGEQYTVLVTSDVGSGIWNPAPGRWPISNPSLTDMCWTNPVPYRGNEFYRIVSTIP